MNMNNFVVNEWTVKIILHYFFLLIAMFSYNFLKTIDKDKIQKAIVFVRPVMMVAGIQYDILIYLALT